MSDDNQDVDVMVEEGSEAELVELKARADLMNLKYHPKIGVDKLRLKVNNALNEDVEYIIEGVDEPDEDNPPVDTTKTLPKLSPKAKPISEKDYKKRQLISRRRAATSLIRIRVTCMNPNKKNWPGEMLSTGSSKLGTIKKYVPFNTDEPYHVQHIIYEMLKERKCTVFTTVVGPRGNKVRKGKLVPEFAIEVMDPLTVDEIEDLAQRQAMSGSIDD